MCHARSTMERHYRHHISHSDILHLYPNSCIVIYSCYLLMLRVGIAKTLSAYGRAVLICMLLET